MCKFQNSNLRTVTYQAVRTAMGGELFAMSLVETDEIRAVVEAVNQGIDGHLEACFCPERGNRYDGGKRKAGKLIVCYTLDCCVSPESLPVLLRRLFELESTEEVMEAASSLANDILVCLGINEYGESVGREAMRLAYRTPTASTEKPPNISSHRRLEGNMPDANSQRRVKIRKNSLRENLYLDHQGHWVPWRDAAWFAREQAAERFAQKHGIEVFGLFPCESCFGEP